MNGDEDRNPKINLYFFEVANINMDPDIQALPKQYIRAPITQPLDQLPKVPI